MSGAGGESVALLSRYGRHLAAGVRIAVFGPVAVVGLVRATGEHAAPTAVVVAGVGAWSAVYVWWLLRRTGLWATAVDVAVLVLVCLSIFWTDAAAQSNVGWIRLLVSFACLAYQWYTPLAYGVTATGVAAGTLLAVVVVTEPASDVVNAAVWVLAIAALSRTAWTLVMRGARSADRLAVEAERARTARRVAEAVRADERDLVNALHDTAATTLLMVGSGQVRPGDGWLPTRARRDLDMLRAYGQQAPAEADLVRLLRAEVEAVSQLPVRFAGPPDLPVPYRVARAVADAAREALNNVVRHAGAGQIQVRLSGDPGDLRVEVVDDGRGFAPDRVPATRRGLRDCVHGRLAAVGGAARVASRPGAGTTVSLEWRDG
ncbi:ATP-binding protein [Phytohabitans sp. ZYX-F-186]|uniref:ATP-binding protein n=1 Tax=Phytohabitans maris TaxID=3071409 RepID=A0ABU0ZN98_9ACTN|nr:ATP-binding protein [Phytohabitans sp. ZYX-F-186]MDQ7908519.1 ATP-binding protein [Phytohabitans sp. ZYX-F-186]